MYGLAQREGFVVVTGEVGAGKTTLIERLCAELEPTGFTVGRIMTTLVSGDDLLRLVADSFGAPLVGDKASVLRGVIDVLKAADRRHLLIVDEAQALPHSALEELRMLSNVNDSGQALLQIVLLGQPQLRQVIASPNLDQLRQRILASYHLSGLSADETRAYVEHRMCAVGWSGTPAWEEGTFELVHRFTGGIPRRINRLCSRVLLSGSLEEADRLTVPMVEAMAQELEEDLGAGLDHARSPTSSSQDYYSASRFKADELHARVEELVHRVAALEDGFARRERVFQRLLDVLAGNGGGR
jgi:type II secretory pathway predicted ATPase ExeA